MLRACYFVRGSNLFNFLGDCGDIVPETAIENDTYLFALGAQWYCRRNKRIYIYYIYVILVFFFSPRRTEQEWRFFFFLFFPRANVKRHFLLSPRLSSRGTGEGGEKRNNSTHRRYTVSPKFGTNATHTWRAMEFSPFDGTFFFPLHNPSARRFRRFLRFGVSAGVRQNRSIQLRSYQTDRLV